MEKIRTIFERGEKGGVIDRRTVAHFLLHPSDDALSSQFHFERVIATEKLDGMNVRLTVRDQTLVRIEARRNPTKVQKQQGIVEPWYRDVWDLDTTVGPADKYLLDAAQHTNLLGLKDGEYPGEAVGPKIQGNPLDLERRFVALFGLPEVQAALAYPDVPVDFDELREWFGLGPPSHLNADKSPEGIVWWGEYGDERMPIGKIKAKDFKA